MAPARGRFAEGVGLAVLLSPGTAPEDLERFLACFCAIGRRLTEPVEGWIRRAGERCTSTGQAELGRALAEHAATEADHHLLMSADLRSLLARRAARGAPPLDVEWLLNHAPSVGAARYLALHEDTIAGPSP